MDDNRKIKEVIQKLAGTYLKEDTKFVFGVVEDVNAEEETCDVINTTGQDAVKIPNVKLQASIGDGFLLIPKIGSDVIVAYSKYSEPFICLTSDIDKIYMVADSAITLNNGSYGGLIKVADLVTKINRLENDINTLKTAFSSWVVVPNDGGSALKASAASWYGSSITPLTQRSDIENTKITHGN